MKAFFNVCLITILMTIIGNIPRGISKRLSTDVLLTTKSQYESFTTSSTRQTYESSPTYSPKPPRQPAPLSSYPYYLSKACTHVFIDEDYQLKNIYIDKDYPVPTFPVDDLASEIRFATFISATICIYDIRPEPLKPAHHQPEFIPSAFISETCNLAFIDENDKLYWDYENKTDINIFKSRNATICLHRRNEESSPTYFPHFLSSKYLYRVSGACTEAFIDEDYQVTCDVDSMFEDHVYNVATICIYDVRFEPPNHHEPEFIPPVFIFETCNVAFIDENDKLHWNYEDKTDRNIFKSRNVTICFYRPNRFAFSPTIINLPAIPTTEMPCFKGFKKDRFGICRERV